MSLFPPFVAGGDEGKVLPFIPAAAQSIKPGSLVYFDTADQRLKLCGADPALILGLSLADQAAATIYPDGTIPVLVLKPSTVVILSSSTTLAETNRAVAYGVVKDATTGYWQVDTADAVNTRVIPVKIDTGINAAYVRFLAANLQLDAVAS